MRCFTRTVEMAPKGAKAACSASTDGGAAPSHTTFTDLALNDLIVASRELMDFSRMNSGCAIQLGQSMSHGVPPSNPFCRVFETKAKRPLCAP